MSDFGKILEQWESAPVKSPAKKKGPADPPAPNVPSPERGGRVMSEDLIDRYPPNETGEGESKSPQEGDNLHQGQKVRPEQIPVEAEIDLHGYRLEEAIMVTNQFLDDSLAQGMRKIRVIHGKGDNGQGVLRKEIRQLLEKHPRTGQMGYGKGSEGGRGALWVMLRYAT